MAVAEDQVEFGVAARRDIVVDARTLSFEEPRDGPPEPIVREPVRRERARRFEAARDLVLALGAGVKVCESALDAVLDALVVAGLEVQRVLGPGCAPVAAVQPAAALDEDRRRHRLAVALGELDHDGARQRARNLLQERDVEVVAVAMTQERAFGKAEHDPPHRVVERLSGKRAERDAGLGDPAPFAPGLLALVGTKGREEVLEARVAAVAPEEAAVVTAQEPGALEGGLVLVVREVDVRSGGAGAARGVEQQACHLFAEFARRCGRNAGSDEQARPGHGRERHCRELLRVIVVAGAQVRLCPAPVEDELAPGMRLEILRHGGDEPAAAGVAHDEVGGNPAGVAADAAGGLEAVQERVPGERVAGGIERIPVARRDVRDPFDDFRLQGHGYGAEAEAVTGGAPDRAGAPRQWALPASSTSRYLSASSAAMQPVPAEVTAWR